MKTYLKLVLVVTIFLASVFFPKKIYAVTITINSYPHTIDSTNLFETQVSISGATNATNYLRVDLYKDGTTNYFGETFNGSDWYGGSDGKSYFPVLVQNATASATLKFQLGNPSSTDYQGPGNYKLKIRRYTSSGSASSNDSQSPVDLTITYQTPSPSPTVAPTPTSTPTPTITSVPTSTPTVIPTKAPTPKPTQTQTPLSSPSLTPEVLGDSSVNEPSDILPTMTPKPSTPKIKSNVPILPIVLIGTGLSMIGFVVLQLINAKRLDKKNNSMGSSNPVDGTNI